MSIQCECQNENSADHNSGSQRGLHPSEVLAGQKTTLEDNVQYIYRAVLGKTLNRFGSEGERKCVKEERAKFKLIVELCCCQKCVLLLINYYVNLLVEAEYKQGHIAYILSHRAAATYHKTDPVENVLLIYIKLSSG